MGFWSSIGGFFSSGSNQPQEDSDYTKHAKAIHDFELKPKKPSRPNTQAKGSADALSLAGQDEPKLEATELDNIESADEVAKHFRKASPPSGVRVKKD